MRTPILRPGEDLPDGIAYLPAEETTSLWGRLPCAADSPVLRLRSGDEAVLDLSLIHISEPTRQCCTSRMPSSA